MGFGDADLILFGHHINPGADRPPEHWGPPPRGLHYARFLFRDGPEAGMRRLGAMTIEEALRPSPAPETWASALPEEEHPTTYVADRTVEFLRRVHRTRPWFCWTSFTDPHHPMDPPAPWCDRYAAADMTVPARHPEEFERKPSFHRVWANGLPEPMAWANPGGARLSDRQLAEMMAGYYGMVAQLDHALGRVLRALRPHALRHDARRGRALRPRSRPRRDREPLGRPGLHGDSPRSPRAARRGREPFAPSPAQHRLARVTALVGTSAAQ